MDPRVEAAKADRQRFLDMTLDEFSALPDAEKLVFVALTNIAFFDEYEASWKKWAATQDQSVPEVSRDSDGQTISDMTIWQMRLAMMFTGDEREKYLRAIAPGMGDSHLYLTLEEWSVANPIRWIGGAAAQNNLLPLETVTQAFDPVDFQGSYSRRMMLGDFLAVYFYNDVTLPDGTVVPIWRRQ